MGFDSVDNGIWYCHCNHHYKKKYGATDLDCITNTFTYVSTGTTFLIVFWGLLELLEMSAKKAANKAKKAAKKVTTTLKHDENNSVGPKHNQSRLQTDESEPFVDPRYE